LRPAVVAFWVVGARPKRPAARKAVVEAIMICTGLWVWVGWVGEGPAGVRGCLEGSLAQALLLLLLQGVVAACHVLLGEEWLVYAVKRCNT
jgi:hypothetical protein